MEINSKRGSFLLNGGTSLRACAFMIRRRGRLRHHGAAVAIGGGSKAVLLCQVFPSEQAYSRIQRRVDRLAFLIVATDISERDISIERLFLKTEAARLFPDRFKFYEMMYESRFDRLVEQFRRHD